jgi:hypothetical protein
MRSVIPATLVAAAFVALSGCSSFHRDASPQQQFMRALQRGNGPQAGQIWLNMSAKDRANLSHSEGFKPIDSPDEMKAKLKAQMQAAGADDGLGGVESGDIEAQQLELPPLDPSGSGGLQNLPNLPSTIETDPASVGGDAR